MAPLSLNTARPIPFALPEGKTALVVIDMQKDFLLKGGYGYLQCPSEEVFEQVSSVIEPTARAIAAARKLGLHVIHTREGHVPDLSDCPPTKRMRQRSTNPERHQLIIGTEGPMGRLLVRGSDGHDIVDELKPLKDEPVLDKPGKGSFYNTDFHQMLVSRGITHILLAGVTTECCVATTFREANDHGFETCVLTDCTNGFDIPIVDATMDLFCAYDGLLGYNCTSQPLLDLAATIPIAPTSPMQTDSLDLSISFLRSAYRTGKLSPTTVLDTVYSKIKACDRSEEIFKKLFDKDIALNSLPAPAVEANFADLPYFYGIPFTVSENFDVMQSKLVQGLIKSGAVLIGVTKNEAVGAGLVASCTVGSSYSAEYAAGGYCYGSALAIALGLGSFALGSDTDGSSRVPAALQTGVVGYNVTKGLLKSDHVGKFCPSLDTVAVFASCVRDARSIFSEMRGSDITSPYSVPDRDIPIKSVDFRGPKVGGFRFAVPADLSNCSMEYVTAFNNFVELVTSMGGTLVDIDWSSYSAASKIVVPMIESERVAFSAATTDCPAVASVIENSKILANSNSAMKVFQDGATLRSLKTEFYLEFEGTAGIDVILTPTVPYRPLRKDYHLEPVKINQDLGTFTRLTNVFDMCAISIDVAPGSSFSAMFSAPMGMDGRMLDIAELFA
ncbi:amidase signature domain-containing protein [Lipomyces oligophaga]|uniref:amidase signature domain-containing protein n=1 Tax=Lipomyces oligophaga TaxID=45792 RepID=UPI0034CEB81F